MARTPTPVVAPDTSSDLAPATLDIISEQTRVLSAAKAAYAEGRDLINQLLGQIQMGDTISKLLLTVSTSKLAYIKENKLYREIADIKTADVSSFAPTWSGFCELIGRSHQQVDEDIRNLKSFGEQALDSMSRMGIGYRELRQFRRLPADERTALIEAAEQGDKTSLLDLAEQLIARQQAEKEKLIQERDAAREDGEAKERLLKQRNERIDKLETRLELRRAKTLDQQTAAWAQELHNHGMSVAGHMLPLHAVGREAASHFFERGEPLPPVIHEQMTAAVVTVVEAAWDLAREFNLSVDLTRFAPPEYLAWRENYENPIE